MSTGVPLGFRCFGRFVGVSWQRGGAPDGTVSPGRSTCAACCPLQSVMSRNPAWAGPAKVSC